MQIKNLSLATLALGVLLVGCSGATGQVSTDDTTVTMDDSTMTAGGWEAATNNAWQDVDGNWRKMENGTLMTSADGQTWMEAEGSAFKAADNMWYQWDAAGTLQSSTDGMAWTTVDSGEWPGAGMTYKMENGAVMVKLASADESATEESPVEGAMEAAPASEAAAQ